MKTILKLILILLIVSCSTDANEKLIIENEQNKELELNQRKSRNKKNVLTLNIPFGSNSFKYHVEKNQRNITVSGLIIEKTALFPIVITYDLDVLKGNYKLTNRTNEVILINKKKSTGIEFITLEKGNTITINKKLNK